MTERGLEPARLARVVAELALGERDDPRSLCSAAAGVVGVCGAGLVLLSERRTLGTLCASDAVVETVEDMQYTSGQGPCIDAFRAKAPVLASDLGDSGVRWTDFRQGALAVGIHAAFGFPLLVGTSCIGTLNLFHDRPGALTDEQWSDAFAVAHVAGRTVLGWQSVAGPGSLAWQLEHVPTHRAVVHQATGMISVQAGVSVADALLLLRAHALAEDHPIGELAADVVGGRLRFD